MSASTPSTILDWSWIGTRNIVLTRNPGKFSPVALFDKATPGCAARTSRPQARFAGASVFNVGMAERALGGIALAEHDVTRTGAWRCRRLQPPAAPLHTLRRRLRREHGQQSDRVLGEPRHDAARWRPRRKGRRDQRVSRMAFVIGTGRSDGERQERGLEPPEAPRALVREPL